jgi:DNA-directed RNA polymerases I, II, and III subunit RPABC2
MSNLEQSSSSKFTNLKQNSPNDDIKNKMKDKEYNNMNDNDDDDDFNEDDNDEDSDHDSFNIDDEDEMNNDEDEEEEEDEEGDNYNNNDFNSADENNLLISSIGGGGGGGAGLITNNADSDKVDDDDSDDSDDDSDDENYLQKFDNEIHDNIIERFHPESIIHNYEEVKAMARITRNSEGIIIDKLHKTVPFLTKYEKTSIIGQRAKQINSGSMPFIDIPNNIMDGYLIALMELEQKKIPFIIRRPIPDGSCEYWNVNDLEIIN